MGRKAKQPVNQDTEKREPEIKKTVKEKKVIDKIILWKDEVKINELQNKLNEILPFANKVIKAYHALPFAAESAGFYDILANTSANANAHLRNTLPDKMDIAGVTLNKAKVLSMGLIEVDGITEFNKALDEFNTAGYMNYQLYFKHDEKAIIIDPVVWQKFKDSHTIAAITPEEIELYNQWKNFIETIENFIPLMAKFRVKMLVNPLGPLAFIHTIKVDRQGKWQVNYMLFAEVTKKLRNKE